MAARQCLNTAVRLYSIDRKLPVDILTRRYTALVQTRREASKEEIRFKREEQKAFVLQLLNQRLQTGGELTLPPVLKSPLPPFHLKRRKARLEMREEHIFKEVTARCRLKSFPFPRWREERHIGCNWHA